LNEAGRGGEGGPTLRTDPRAGDPRIRGRTYAIPFERVWRAALALAGGGLNGWRLLTADEDGGVVDAEATSRILRRRSAIRVEIGLDENAQTRVDVGARALTGRFPHLGRNARFVGGFLTHLDRELGARADHILDPNRRPAWIDAPARTEAGPAPSAVPGPSAGEHPGP